MPRRALVLSFDRLHLGFLGCYGNDWIETPNFDRLATEAVVFDQHYGENFSARPTNHAWWTGRHQFPLDADQQRELPTFLDELRSAGITSRLLIETDGRDDTRVAPPFDEVHAVRGEDGLEVHESQTPFARLVDRSLELMDTLRSEESPSLLWIQSRGVPSPWLPPRGFADLYLEEFGLGEREERESEADDLIDSGEESETAETTQPDVALERRYARSLYAAYVTLLDRWLGKFLDALRRHPLWSEALLIVTAGSGQMLGEHGTLGDEPILLREELIHAPLFIRDPLSDQHLTRRHALVQTIDLAPTLLDWLAETGARDFSLLPILSNTTDTLHETLLLGNARSEWSLRTAEFFYVLQPDRLTEDGRPVAALFEKPCDRWDMADVLSQYPQQADDLHAALLQQVGQLIPQTVEKGS